MPKALIRYVVDVPNRSAVMNRMTRSADFAPRMVLMGLLVAMGAEAARAGDAALGRRPANVVLMLVDNVGYGDLGCYGNRSINPVLPDYTPSNPYAIKMKGADHVRTA